MDELRTVDPADVGVTLTAALRICIVPLFPVVNMNAAALFSGIKLDSAGSATMSSAIYKAINPSLNARKSFTPNTVNLFSRGPREWLRIAIGPARTTDNASTYTRYLWVFDKEIEIRTPEIYGVAFMVSDTNMLLQAGSVVPTIHTAFMDRTTRSGIVDYPQTLSTNQDGGVRGAPAVCLRSARALSWAGG